MITRPYCQRLCILGHHGAIEIAFIIIIIVSSSSSSSINERNLSFVECKKNLKSQWPKKLQNFWCKTFNTISRKSCATALFHQTQAKVHDKRTFRQENYRHISHMELVLDSDVNKANSVKAKAKAKARQYKAKAKASHFKG